MQYFLLGLAALAVILILMRGFTRANATVLARQLRVTGGVLALGAAGILLFRGLGGYAMPLAALGSWLLWGQGMPRLGGWGQGPRPGQTSRIVTDTLEAELEHDSGALRGRVRTGLFAGRDIESLTPAELAELWLDCRFADPTSAQIIEAWLDRTHPTWQEDLARRTGGGTDARDHSEAPPRRPRSGGMSRDEAYEILGLAPGATSDDIRRAHRELMMKMHPDRGGSTYIAAKINEAKDLLLGD